MSKGKFKIVGICGSLRKGSYNQKLLDVILKMISEADVEVEQLNWEDFVVYNEDIQDAGMPQNVEAFKDKIAAADGIVFATPEYNFSIPGGLKNAMDWASRPDSDLERVFGEDKAALLAGVSSGVRGTARAQMHMANLCQDLGLLMYPSPLLVGTGSDAFDGEGNLVKEGDVARAKKSVGKFVDLVGKLRG